METTTTPESPIRKRLESWAQALRAKDVDAVMAHYASDVVTFDIRPPLSIDADLYRKNFEAWFASVQGPIDYETRDLRIAISGDLAFCHYLGHVRSTRTTGENADYWVRVTSGFQNIDGQWMITHEHVSVPIDMANMRALFDLQP